MHTASVIVPTYNCAQRLERALESIAAQTIAPCDVEILVVDDGSTDDTRERVAAFARRSATTTRYVHQQNAGPAAARNHGLRLARGEALAFLDADDAWHRDKLARQLPLLGAGVGLVYCDTVFTSGDGRALARYVRRTRLVRGDILLPLFCDFFLLTSSVVLSRAVIDTVGAFDERLPVGEDYEFFLRVAARFRADYADGKLLARCVRPDSLSRRDYALDARVDLATLENFLRARPDFARRHRAAVRRRLARYRHDFAWSLLADGRRGEAIGELLRSLRTRPGVASARTLARALLPRLPAARVAQTASR